MGLSILVAASRQTWAFSRDGALPFSKFFRPISVRFGYIPLRAVWGCAFLAAVLGLLCLIAPAAAQALFSLAVAGNNLAWGTPIFCRIWWGQRKFVPGPFYTGDKFSVPIAWTAIIFLIFGVFLSMFPVGGPNPTRKWPHFLLLHEYTPICDSNSRVSLAAQTMNYTVVINMATWIGAIAYYYIDARKWFTGPKITVDADTLTEDQAQALREEGLQIEGVKRPSFTGEEAAVEKGSTEKTGQVVH